MDRRIDQDVEQLKRSAESVRKRCDGGFSGVNGLPNGGDPAIPGLVLSTDSGGNIISWIMSASSPAVNPAGELVGTGVLIINPPIFRGSECAGLGLTDLLSVDTRLPSEWDAFTSVAAVPEPGTLTLLGAGLLIVARRRLTR